MNLKLMLVMILCCKYSSQETKTLQILDILPGSTDVLLGQRRIQDAKRGVELAIQHVNQHFEMFGGHNLTVLHIDSGKCKELQSSETVVEVYRSIFGDQGSCTVAMMGLFCPFIANDVAHVFSHPQFSYVQLVSAFSSKLRSKLYKNLFFSTPSSFLYDQAIIGLMDHLNWTRLTVVYDNQFIADLNFIANSSTVDGINDNSSSLFMQRLSQKNITFHQIQNGRQGLSPEYRVIYSLTTTPESAVLMCEALKTNRIWPKYVHIFNGKSIQDFLMSYNVTKCSRDEMLQAIEGVILMNFDLQTDDNEILVSGMSMKKYLSSYYAQEQNDTLNDSIKIRPSVYAHVQYDQVWALALALNTSMKDLPAQEESFCLNNGLRSANLTDTMQDALMQVRFQGASGFVDYRDDQDEVTTVQYLQVRQRKEILFAKYKASKFNLIDHTTLFPSDHFKTVLVSHIALHTRMIFIVLYSILFIFITFQLILVLVFRKEPEVKATSPYLSLFIFMGCYMQTIANFLLQIDSSSIPSIALCLLAQLFVTNSNTFIFATILVKLVRINYVFNAFKKTGKFCSNMASAVYISVLSSISVFLSIIQVLSIKNFNKVTITMFSSSADEPHYLLNRLCELPQWYFPVNLTYLVILLLPTVWMAFKTRHIKRQNFKNTKKINVFVILTMCLYAFFYPTFLLLRTSGQDILAYLISNLVFPLIPLPCQVLLFVPKTTPPLRRCLLKSKKISHLSSKLCSRSKPSIK